MKWFILILCLGIGGLFVIYFLHPFGLLQQQYDTQRKSDIANLQQALDQYYKNTGAYPLSTATDAKKPYRIAGFRADHLVVDWGEEWEPYLKLLPKDPDNQKQYVYFASPNGQAYWIYASLDTGSDQAACNQGKACQSISGNSITPLACGGVCNYGVSSRNVSP